MKVSNYAHEKWRWIRKTSINNVLNLFFSFSVLSCLMPVHKAHLFWVYIKHFLPRFIKLWINNNTIDNTFLKIITKGIKLKQEACGHKICEKLKAIKPLWCVYKAFFSRGRVFAEAFRVFPDFAWVLTKPYKNGSACFQSIVIPAINQWVKSPGNKYINEICLTSPSAASKVALWVL